MKDCRLQRPLLLHKGDLLSIKAYLEYGTVMDLDAKKDDRWMLGIQIKYGGILVAERKLKYFKDELRFIAREKRVFDINYSNYAASPVKIKIKIKRDYSSWCYY